MFRVGQLFAFIYFKAARGSGNATEWRILRFTYSKVDVTSRNRTGDLSLV